MRGEIRKISYTSTRKNKLWFTVVFHSYIYGYIKSTYPNPNNIYIVNLL